MDYRVHEHPILPVEERQEFKFVEVALGTFAGVITGEGPAEETQVSHATDAHEGGL